MVSVLGATRQMESLDRGLVAVVRADRSVYLSWRLLATDPVGVSFHVYRALGESDPVRLTAQPLAKGTNWVHEAAKMALPSRYMVRAVVAGKEGKPSAAVSIPAEAPPKAYLSVPLQTPDGYLPNDASVGDLDGDGQYEIVLHQAGRAHDNSHAGETDPPILQAYKLDGTRLWQINLGRNIREGAHYTQFIVYDLDGDGRAEVACKTADGTVDGRGKVLGDAEADHRSEHGYILRGPEFLTVFDGLTGAALATTDYVPPRTPGPQHTRAQMKAIWGDDYGNRVDRFLAGVAYLDGERPSLIMCRGYYTRSVLAAWDWRDGKLSLRWVFDSADGTPGNKAYTGQGNHNLAVGDVDGDGKDEIVYGACTIDDDGTGLYSTGLGHGDAIHVSDIDPARPGLEVWGIHEHPKHPHAVNLRDAATGKVLWSRPSSDVGRGMSMDVDPRYPGYECWAAGRGVRQLFSSKGEIIADSSPWCNMGIWWDGDLLREVLSGVTIAKWDIATEKTVPILEGKAFGCAQNNGTKANPCLAADILGDWREELVCRTVDGKELRRGDQI
ncbi:MAG: rhamnogalacturonan lyase [Victivallales bacterium]|nr:rhamnogalacturonan lyase [Victivallales bacterium]